MDFLFDESQEIFRKSVREFLERECSRDKVRHWDETSTFPMEAWSAMAELGWLALGVSEKYGGASGTALDCILFIEELTRRCGALGFAFSLLSLDAILLEHFATEVQKQDLLPRLANGKITIALGMTEPSGGTDILALSTSAQLEKDVYILNGQKTWISLGKLADYLLVLARTDPSPEKKSKGLTLFLVDAKTPGIEIRTIKKTTYRSVDSAEIFLNEVSVSASQIIGELGNGFRHLFVALDYERVTAAALALGNAAAAFDDARQYALERHAFGRPIGQFQAIQHYLARMHVSIEQSRWLMYRAAWLQDHADSGQAVALEAKVAATEAAVQVTSDALRIFASYGVSAECDVQRYFRDARLGLFSPITNEMALNTIGQKLGLPRCY